MKLILKGIAVFLALVMIISTVFAEEENRAISDSGISALSEEISDDSSTSESSETHSSSDELTGEKEGNSSPEDEENDNVSSSEGTGDTEDSSPSESTGDSDGGSTSEDASGGEGSTDSGDDSASEDDSSEDGDETDDTKEESTKKPSSTKKSSGISYANVRTKAIWDKVSVTVEELGTIHTQIKVKDELITVLTHELDFADIDETQLQLGYIIAPKTGRAAMRDKAAKGETIIRYCDAGDMAIILEIGEDYTHILYKGTEGYVLSDTVQPIEIPEENGEYAQLSKEGRTDTGAIINIRNLPDRNSCKIVEWRTGTELTVWDLVDGWYEIEAHGMRGFVMEEFVTIDPGV